MTELEKKKLHTETIKTHRKYVAELCTLMGIEKLGEQHDLSKFFVDEFEIYKWADGTKSPHDIARAELGYNPSWCLHKARNPHHWEYWLSFYKNNINMKGKYNMENKIELATQKWLNNPNNPNYWLDFNEAKSNGDGTFTITCTCVKMPYDRVIEMFCDFVGAGRAYNKDTWTTKTPWEYWKKECEGKRAMHADSQKLIKLLLKTLSMCESIDEFIDWYSKTGIKLKQDY